MKTLQRISCVSVLLVLVGCAARTYTPHPGSYNNFDSQAYDSLLVAHDVIESTKADLAANKWTPNVASVVKEALNNLIKAYNAADSAYLVYHANLAAGTATPTQQATVNADLTQVNTATTNLSVAKGAK